MQSNDVLATFGPVAQCLSLEEILIFLRGIPFSNLSGRKCAAAFCMVLVAKKSARSNTYYEDALHLLNDLSQTKAKLDVVTSHEIVIAQVTSHILLAAQEFVNKTTIPPTEWATTEEIAGVVISEAAKYAKQTSA